MLFMFCGFIVLHSNSAHTNGDPTNVALFMQQTCLSKIISQARSQKSIEVKITPNHLNYDSNTEKKTAYNGQEDNIHQT